VRLMANCVSLFHPRSSCPARSSLRSATEWLSSTAMRIFSSSSESVSKDGESTDRSQNNSSPIWHPRDQHPQRKSSRTDADIGESRSRGRPRKNPAEPRRHNMTFTRELLSMKGAMTSTRTRSSATKTQAAGPEGGPPLDGQTRYLLTLAALPRNIQILALVLHPPPRNKFEEHRLACRLFNEHLQETVHPEISIPTFRRLGQLRSHKDAEKNSLAKGVSRVWECE
jgi:hypothetical protein